MRWFVPATAWLTLYFKRGKSKLDTDTASPRPLLMGIVNVTPDSFSDGGRYLSSPVAINHAQAMINDGADILDIGAESTRPGAAPVSETEQLDRLLPVIEGLMTATDRAPRISVDTRSPQVARAALKAGATIVNDVGGGELPAMLNLVAASKAAIVLMHMQGTPQTMQAEPQYKDVVAEVKAFLLARASSAEAAGIAKEKIMIDPGIGFGKTRMHNLKLLASLNEFVATGYPVLLGTSRKRFMGRICNETVFSELVGATCATTALGVQAGVGLFRVHDVKANRQAADVAWACVNAAKGRDALED